MNGAQIQWITAGALLLFAVLMISIGVISYRKAKTIDGFLLGGRNVGPIVSAFAYGTSYFSAVIFVGYAGKHGWDIGVSSMWIGVGNAVLGCLLAWCVLAKPTRRMTHRLKSKTMPEFFEGRYDSKALKIISALIIFIFLVPYSAAVYKGLGAMFNVIFPNISVNWCMFIIAALTAVYLVLGGYLATVYTDFVQGIIMIGGIALMIVSVLKYLGANGTDNVFEALAAIPMGEDGVSGAKLTSVWGGSSFKFLCTNILLTSFGTWGLPQMVTKYYAIKDDKNSIKHATWISTLFCLIIGCGAYFTGSLSRLVLSNTLPQGGKDFVIPQMLITALGGSSFTVIILAVILILLLSASMSTLASVVLSSASAVSVDLVPEIKKDLKPKSQMVLTRVLCLVFVALSYIFATLNITIIVNIMSFSWGVVSGAFIGPYIMGLFSKKAEKKSAFCGMFAGLLGIFVPAVWLTVTGGFPAAVSHTPEMGVLAMAVSIVVTTLVSRFEKPMSPEKCNLLFDKEEK